VVELVAIAMTLFTPRECTRFVRHCAIAYGVMKSALNTQWVADMASSHQVRREGSPCFSAVRARL